MPKHKWALKKAGVEERQNFANTLTGTILTEAKSYAVKQVGEYTKTTFSNLIKNSTKNMVFYGKNFNPMTFGSVGMKAGLSAANSVTGGLDKTVSTIVDNMLDYQIHGVNGEKMSKLVMDQPERSAAFDLTNFYKKYGVSPSPEQVGYIGDGISNLVSKWEWKSYFREPMWRDKIVPHLLKEQFKDVLATVQSGIVAQYPGTPNSPEMNAALESATRELEEMFHNYSLDLANNTEFLGAPINFLPNPERQAREREDVQKDTSIPMEERAKLLKEMDTAVPALSEKELASFTKARIKGTPYKSNMGPLQTRKMTELGIKQNEAELKQAKAKEAEEKAKAEEARKKAEAELREKEAEVLGQTMAEVEDDLFDTDRNVGMTPKTSTESQPTETTTDTPETPDTLDDSMDMSEWDLDVTQDAHKKEVIESLPKWQQKMFGYTPRVERGFFSSMTNGLYQYVASTGYDYAGKAAQATMKRMAKAAYDPMTLAGMSFNKRSIAGRAKGTVIGRYADTVANYVKSFGDPNGPFFVTGDAVAREAFETYKFSESKRNDFYNEFGFDFDSDAVLKGIADDIRNWEDKDQFYDKNWREEIIPHILRTSFERELEKVHMTILERYGKQDLNNMAALEYKLDISTRMLAYMYQDYSNTLAEKTGLLEMPLFCASKKNIMNDESLKNLLGPKKYADFKKKFESQPPLINEKKVRDRIKWAKNHFATSNSEDIARKVNTNLRNAIAASKTYEPDVLMKAISDVRELEARCAKTGFFARNIPFFNRSYKRTMALKETMKDQIREYVASRDPKPDVKLDDLFSLNYPFETDAQITRQMESREYRKEFPQKSTLEKAKDMVVDVANATLETAKSAVNTVVNTVQTVYNVVTSESGQKIIGKAVDVAVETGLNTLKTAADATIDAGIKIGNLALTGAQKLGEVVSNTAQTVADTVSTVTEVVTDTAKTIGTTTLNAVQTGLGYIGGTMSYGAGLISAGFNWMIGNDDPIEENPEEELSQMSEEEAKEIDRNLVEMVKEDGGLEAVEKRIPDPEVLNQIAPEVAKEIEQQKALNQGAPETQVFVDPETNEKILFSEVPEEPTMGNQEPETFEPVNETLTAPVTTEPELDQVLENTANTINEGGQYEEDEDEFEDALDEEAFEAMYGNRQEEPQPDPVAEKRDALTKSISDFREALESKQQQLRESLRTASLSGATPFLSGIIVTSTLDQAAADSAQKLSQVDPQLSAEDKLAEYAKIEKNLTHYQHQMEEPEFAKNVAKVQADPQMKFALIDMLTKDTKMKEKLIMMADSKTTTEVYVNTYRTKGKEAAAKKNNPKAPVKQAPDKVIQKPTTTMGGPAV